MGGGGAYFVGCLEKFNDFFYIDTFQIVISIYKRIVRIFFRKIYGHEINGINQGSYLKYRFITMNIGIFPCGLINQVVSYDGPMMMTVFTTVSKHELIWFAKRVYIRSNTSDCLYIMPYNVNHSWSPIPVLSRLWRILYVAPSLLLMTKTDCHAIHHN